MASCTRGAPRTGPTSRTGSWRPGRATAPPPRRTGRNSWTPARGTTSPAMARRIDKDRLRFLPLHLALEGYLALSFGGPEIAWEEWSRRAIDNGLSPRAEEAYTGA